MDFDVRNLSRLLYGGDKVSDDNVEIKDKTSDTQEKTTIEVYHPKITRETLSIYEYVGVITKLAKYLNNMTDLDKYLTSIEVNQIINPAELAFNLLNDGKFDAIIDRGYELVTFSTLKVRKQWKDTISNYFKSQHDTIEREILQPLDILDK